MTPVYSDAVPIETVLERTNQKLMRVRHPRGGEQPEPGTAAYASATSSDYVAAFWPHVSACIAADPIGLGLSASVQHGGDLMTISAESLQAAFCADESLHLPENEKAWRGGVLAGLSVMQQVLNNATATFADDLTAQPRRCPLDFLVDTRRFVSLRMLLPRRGDQQDRVGGNAPTLVMGGTATALTMCWNLLDQLPRAYREASGQALTRDRAEQIWDGTRELIFRIGSGSLAAFVALASACATDPNAMLWDGASELGLRQQEEQFVWTMSTTLRESYAELLETVLNAQDGHYVGCAALFARVAALPLDESWADPVDAGREQPAFAELLRWTTGAARRLLFAQLPAG